MPEFLKQHGRTVGLTALVTVIVGWMMFGGGRDEAAEMASVRNPFYDPVTGKYFEAAAQAIPPIESPFGNEGVRAHFFSCGPCDPANAFLGYYSKYTPDAQALRGNRPGEDVSPAQMRQWEQAVAAGRLISRDGAAWNPLSPRELIALERELASACSELRHFRACHEVIPE
jgi:hypothetical protein